MRNIFLSLLSGAALLVSLACGIGENYPAVDVQPRQTVKEAVDSLPPAGGVVSLGFGVWESGYGPTDFIARPNITIQGSGMPGFNSTFTAMKGGTIVRGHLPASTGANYFTVEDLGIDVGSEYINANNGGVASNGFAIFNDGQVIGAPPVQSPRIVNVSCLGYSPKAAFHCMLVENVNSAFIHNVVAVMNCHGLVLKGTNSTVDGVTSRGHGIDSVIVKSDVYAPASQDNLSHIVVKPLIVAGDTKGIVIEGDSAPISKINITGAIIDSPFAWGVYVRGAKSTAAVTSLSLSDITIDYHGASPPFQYCMQFLEYVSAVDIANLHCSNMWAGIVPTKPASGVFNDFSVANSLFALIATNGIETYGQWNVSNTSFGLIDGNGIVATSGITTVSADTFIEIGGSDMYPSGGTFVVANPAESHENENAVRF